MQSYYRLRLISMKGCHLLLYYSSLVPVESYHTPHKHTTCNVFMVEVEGVAPSSSLPITCRQQVILCSLFIGLQIKTSI